jgi:hypothetical protein
MKISQSPNLQFEAQAKELQQAIQKVVSITSFVDCLDTERRHAMLVSDGKAYIVGITPDAFACVCVGKSAGGKNGAFIFEPAKVQGLIKNRDGLSISGDKAELIVQALKGKYRATTELQLLDDADIVRLKDVFNPPKSKKLSREVIKAIREGIKAASLTNFYTDDIILSFVKVSEKGVVIESADNFHLSQYKAKVKSDVTLRFAIPTRTFNMLDRFIGDSEPKISLNGSQLCIRGDDYVVSVPEIQEDEFKFSMVAEFLKSLPAPSMTVTFNPESLKAVDNMFAIVTEDTKMAMQFKDKGIKMKMLTKSGSVEDACKAQIKGDPRTIHVDPRILKDLFDKIKDDEVPMNLFKARNKGATSTFCIVTQPAKGVQLTQLGTFYDE